MASPRDAVRTECQRHALERLALEAVAKNIGPGDGEAGIGRPQRRYLHALGGERLRPCAVGAQPRPACAAERQHGRARLDDVRSIRRLKTQTALLVPAGPAVTQRQSHAHRVQPPQPGPQQGRCLERFWKYPAAGADKGFLPQRLAPVAQRLRRERFDGGCEMRHRLAVAREELRQRFAMREVEPASPGHQELAAGGRHRVVDGDVAPPCASTSAAIRPAGPAPMTATCCEGDDMAGVYAGSPPQGQSSCPGLTGHATPAHAIRRRMAGFEALRIDPAMTCDREPTA